MTHDESSFTKWLQEDLGNATRKGVYGAKRTKDGVPIRYPEGERVVSHAEIEAVVASLPGEEIEAKLEKLRMNSLTLEEQQVNSALGKLRIMVAWGLGGARWWTDDERRDAFARLYPVPGSASKTYQAYGRMPRELRNSLKSNFANLVIARYPPVSPLIKAEVVAGNVIDHASDAVVIETYEDRHSYERLKAGWIHIVDRRRKLIAQIDGVSSYEAPFRIVSASGARPVIKVDGIPEMHIEDLESEKSANLEGVSYTLRLTFPALNKGCPVLLRWTVTSILENENFMAVGEIGDATLIPQYAIKSALISVHFASDARPGRVWSFSDALVRSARREAGGSPPKVAKPPYFEISVASPRQGRATGLGWRW